MILDCLLIRPIWIRWVVEFERKKHVKNIIFSALTLLNFFIIMTLKKSTKIVEIIASRHGFLEAIMRAFGLKLFCTLPIICTERGTKNVKKF